MDPLTRGLAMGAAGGGGEVLGIEDVFSTWLYTGNGSTQTITNGIDLSGKGGLAWIKSRTNAYAHALFDTERGAGALLSTSNTASQSTGFGQTFTGTGFTFTNGGTSYNSNNEPYSSWTFRKAAKFFDVVTYTGTGADQTISHNLGSTPGCIIVKRTDTTGDWYVYHRSLTTATQNWITLNTTGAANGAIGQDLWGPPTSTTFKVDTYLGLSTSGGTYVAYLFAHDAGGFGDSGNDNVISCGSFTTDGSGNATVTLGWEPQWVLIKSSGSTGNWLLVDNMRGWSAGNDAFLYANTSGAEITGADLGECNSTGFSVKSLGASASLIYIAIRRGPMKTPTDATKVYENIIYTGNQTANRVIGSTVLTDAVLVSDRDATSQSWTTIYAHYFFDRLKGFTTLSTAFANAQVVNWNGYFSFARNIGWDTSSAAGNTYLNKTSTKYVSHNFRRAPGFFDVVAYTGNGTFDGSYNVNHSLGVTPEFIIVKRRNSSNYWNCYHVALTSATYNIQLNLASAQLNTGQSWGPTSTTFKPQYAGNTNYSSNDNTATYIAYLFATCPGVSKVGSYTGTGTTLNVDCGFTNGARFVLIKRTDSTGDWYVWDTARGIVSGNDPYLLMNLTDSEVTNTDYIDPLSSGFQISSTAPAAINASGGSFIFLAIA